MQKQAPIIGKFGCPECVIYTCSLLSMALAKINNLAIVDVILDIRKYQIIDFGKDHAQK